LQEAERQQEMTPPQAAPEAGATFEESAAAEPPYEETPFEPTARAGDNPLGDEEPTPSHRTTPDSRRLPARPGRVEDPGATAVSAVRRCGQ